MLFYVAMTVAGSVVGCLALHYLGRKGGEALVRRKFTGEKIEQAMATLQRHGVMAVLVPCLLPPPSPFKIFILLAGVVGISATRLAVAIAIGRGVRYLTLGFLAVTYGERALAYMRENGAMVSLAAVGVLAIGFTASLLWRKARAGQRR
jgi:membrane protein YqaA with SNARE-associated domain